MSYLRVFLCFLCIPTLAFGQGYQKSTHQVPMRDGVQLATDLYRPTGATSPRPTILMRTPYNKDKLAAAEAERWVTEGYNLVVQDMRGRFSSEGLDRVFQDDGWGKRQDGFDTLSWITAQSWSNEKVGTTGASAHGIAQYMMAGAAPPGLVCQFVMVATPSMYHHAVRQGGGYRKHMMETWLKGQGSEHVLQDYATHGLYDDYWRVMDLSTRWSSATVPALHVGGWNDIFIEGTIQAFRGLQQHGGPGAKGSQRLLVGPWTHGGLHTTSQGQLTYGADSVYKPEIEIQWFEHCLKGEQNAFAALDPVFYYVMGDGWRTADSWPPLPASAVKLYLAPGGALTRAHPAVSVPPASLDTDPSNPVPTLGGANLSLPAGPHDQRSIEGRSDVLVYSTEPLTGPVEVIGTVRLQLFISVDTKDADFTARLTDVYPDGRSMLVADGILRARHRQGFASEAFLDPETPAELTITVGTTALRFKTGHRIRVVISGTNTPRFGPNPNTGAPFLPSPKVMVPSHAAVHVDCDHPSALVIRVASGAERLGTATTARCGADGGMPPSPDSGTTADAGPSVDARPWGSSSGGCGCRLGRLYRPSLSGLFLLGLWLFIRRPRPRAP